jgi:hypothetical protein
MDDDVRNVYFRFLKDAMMLSAAGHDDLSISQMMERSMSEGLIEQINGANFEDWLKAEYGKGGSSFSTADLYTFHLRECCRFRGMDPLTKQGVLDPWPPEMMDQALASWNVGLWCKFCDEYEDERGPAMGPSPDGEGAICFAHVGLFLEALLWMFAGCSNRPIYFVRGFPF